MIMVNSNNLLIMLKQVVESIKQVNEYHIKVLELQEVRTYNEQKNNTTVKVKVKTKLHYKQYEIYSINDFKYIEEGNTTNDEYLVEQLHLHCSVDNNIKIRHYKNFKHDLGAQKTSNQMHLLINYK